MNETPAAGLGRIGAAVVAIAAMLPYLTLKILWLTGNSLGVTDPEFMEGSVMYGMNAMTFGMEAVALVLALGFTMRWGMRLPAWLVLLPLWVGTGLLGVIVLVTPLGLLIEGPSVFEAAGPIEPWVYVVVYGGFVGQGAGLMTAFALYARDRWPGVLTTAVGLPYPSATRPFQRVVAWGSALMAAGIAAVRLFWAFGGGGGLPPQVADTMTPAGALQQGVKGVLAVAAGAALVVLVRARGRGPFWRPLAVAWLGSGSLFAWGLYAMIVKVTAAPLGAGSTALPGLLELGGLLAGMAMGMAGAFLLAERSGVRDVQPAQQPLEAEDGDGDRQAAYQGHD
ncbi:hypothetical protein OUY22_31055 [Nonomuraea sp. MCN248]|uniref:Uncharacterized protein n=1 Tax=Nonomuraea corallina TaxID=2989783 RepID=A0ABT4SLA5_9ACTN|nr:hypothetical protein [Nonomuraea corallina]MDA0637870.1 hypothetical protein [Nonomuraea corallina]